MILLSPSQSLQIALAGAVATAQPHLYASFVDLASGVLTAPAPATGATNGSTPVTWVPAPAAGARQVKALNCYNADTAAVTATVRINDGGTPRVLRVSTLLPGESLEYGDTTGWRVAAAAVSATPADYISGLRMVYGGPGSITVESGAAYIQGLGRRVDVVAAITKSGLSLAASTWHHAYLLVAGGVPDIEVSTVAPAAPYNGTARSKTGDPSRRYIGSIKTDASGAIYNFKHSGTSIYYQSNVLVAPFIVVSLGNATTFTSVSCATLIPESARFGMFIFSNADTGARVDFGNSEAGAVLMFASPGNSNQARLPLNASREITYKYDTPPTTGVNIRVVGYEYER